MICLDAPVHQRERIYMKCCGKPMCGDCKELCLARAMFLEFGCPHCRSTMDVLYVGFDYLVFDTATMRINGHVEKIDISERAVRRFVRTFSQPMVDDLWPRSVLTRVDLPPATPAWHEAMVFHAKDTMRSFITHEIKSNPLVVSLLSGATENGIRSCVIHYYTDLNL